MARGKAFQEATILHGMELTEDEVIFTVEEVPMPFVLTDIPMFPRLA